MVFFLSLIPGPQPWPITAAMLLLTLIAAVLVQLVMSRPTFPSSAPPLLRGWPVLGCIDFFRSRAKLVVQGRDQTPGGQFSFYYGPHPIVAVSGVEARNSHYNSRGLDPTQGFTTLVAASPITSHLHQGDLMAQAFTMIKRFLQRDRLAQSLERMTADADAAIGNLDTSAAVDPFDITLKLIYQLTHRTLGCNDVADDPRLLAHTLAVFGRVDDSSAVEVMFPMLPWPSKIRKMWAGAKLHWAFTKIMKDRRKTGKIEADAMQTMMDDGHSDIFISIFIMISLFSGLVNSAFSAAWIISHLSDNRDWYERIRAEVDALTVKYRQSPHESAGEVMARVPMAAWETELPLIDVALRETIRLDNQGMSIRKNISGKDIKIGGTDQVIPNNAFAVYSMQDVHMDGRIYRDPNTWDPERYLLNREEDKNEPHAYLGWGSGLHPCLGMRFAKLEITISTVMFFAHYEFERCDSKGNRPTDKLPFVDLKGTGEKRPVRNIFLKCMPRA